MQSVHVRRGDTVGVITGTERGKRGKVLRVIPDKGRVLVEHVNMIKKHQRPTQKLRQGGIIEREGPLALSNVLVVCPRCDKPGRTGIKILTDGRKVRTCRRCDRAAASRPRDHRFAHRRIEASGVVYSSISCDVTDWI